MAPPGRQKTVKSRIGAAFELRDKNLKSQGLQEGNFRLVAETMGSAAWLVSHVLAEFAFVLLIFGALALYARLATTRSERLAIAGLIALLVGIALLLPVISLEAVALRVSPPWRRMGAAASGLPSGGSHSGTADAPRGTSAGGSRWHLDRHRHLEDGRASEVGRGESGRSFGPLPPRSTPAPCGLRMGWQPWSVLCSWRVRSGPGG
jgi:hypothetical protein